MLHKRNRLKLLTSKTTKYGLAKMFFCLKVTCLNFLTKIITSVYANNIDRLTVKTIAPDACT